MKITKKWPFALLAVAVASAGVVLYPKDEPVRHNVIDSSKGESVDGVAHGEGKAQHQPTTDGASAQAAVPADGNSAGLPLRIVNNAPNFNQIVAAAAIVNGAVEQQDAAKFVQLSTAKHIAELQAQLVKLQADISENQLRKEESDKKRDGNQAPKGDVSGGDEFVLPDESPVGDANANAQKTALQPGVVPFTANNPSVAGNEKGTGNASVKEPEVSFSRNIKLKGMTGDGRVALQLGSDFALNVEEGQVVWTRYRIEHIDKANSCVTYTDLRVKHSRGQACYN